MHEISVTQYLRKLSVQARNDLAYSLRGTRGGWDDVRSSATAATPILRGGSVDGLLCRGRGVHGGHQTLDDAEFVVEDFRERREAVGCAGCVGDL